MARLVAFEGPADLYIVNSCTVTATADRQSRQLINRSRRLNPRAKVVLTGCMAATLGPEQLSALGLDAAFALDLHPDLLAMARDLARSHTGEEPRLPADTPAVDAPPRRDRPVLKIQDGCDCACTYCIVPLARGPGRSEDPEGLIRAVEALQARGHGEVVLTGIHLGSYGHDLVPATTLEALLARLPEPPGPRIRLSSIEPLEVTAGLVDLLCSAGDGPELCSHLHIPIQSADEQILAAMGRPYTAAQASRLLQSLRERVPHMGLGADLMTGFPGEDEDAFQATLGFVERSPLTYLHVFPYSPRPGTAAASLASQVPRQEARRRAGVLRKLGALKKAAFARTQVGRTHSVVVEGRRRDDGPLQGLTGNYLTVTFEGPDTLRGERVAVRALEAHDGLLSGQIQDA